LYTTAIDVVEEILEETKMKKTIAMILAMTMLFGLCFAMSGCSGTAKYTIGICQQQPHAALDSATQGFKDAIIAALGEENVKFYFQDAAGDPSTCSTIINDFVTKKVDLIMANATNALQAAANGTTTIPVLGTSVTEYGTALGIENFNGLVGSNVSGMSDLAPLDEQAAMLTSLFPDAKKVGLLYCSAEPNSAYQIKVIKGHLEKAGLTCTEFSFSSSSDIVAVATAAAAASDVIYIPTDNTAAECAEAINGAVLPTKTPIVGGDQGICGGCGIATLCVDYYDLGYATGEMAVKILNGTANIAEMPIGYSAKFSKVYNKSNCDELGIDTAALENAGYTAIGE